MFGGIRATMMGLAAVSLIASPALAARIEIDRCAVRKGNAYVTGLTAKRGTERYEFAIGTDVPRRIAFDPWLAESWIEAKIGRPGDVARYTICGDRFEVFENERFFYLPRGTHD